MKKATSIVLLLLFTVGMYAQTPEGFNYQAVAKDAAGDIMVSTTIGVQIQLRETTIAGAVIYTETHSPTTNANGVFNLIVGQGTSADTFNTIDWANDLHFLEISIDLANGSTYVSVGTTQFMSVPYALHAKTATAVLGNSGTTHFLPKSIDGTALGDSQLFDDGTNVGIGTESPLKALHIQRGGTSLLTSSFGDGMIFSTNSNSGARIFLENLTGSSAQKTMVLVNENVSGEGTTYFGSLSDDGGAFINGSILSMNHSSGNVGIGLHAPTAKLDVAGDIKIADGTQGAGKILTSDADGLASWDDSVINLITDLQSQITLLESQTSARVGDLRAGGVVFWVDPADNRHGLVCAFSDYPSTREWGCFGTDLPNVPNVTSFPSGLGAEIGDGLSNTNNILNDCPTAPAALAARSYGSEWFLPSAKELNEMYDNKATLEAVAGFTPFNVFYWSSTEYLNNAAWIQYFNNGVQNGSNKFNALYVRAVRAF
ncbi:Lcl domain-containing protein [Lacinutrix jangbogonensis]|uniref:Lcl domain-containing protein n=1 Tax=Lacinutrix jangbogonensis TaxID=1469557 RepID=UPI00068DA72A|nr:DUF1566 domain-containing protein [Lacinutrix jangbogonensis]